MLNFFEGLLCLAENSHTESEVLRKIYKLTGGENHEN